MYEPQQSYNYPDYISPLPPSRRESQDTTYFNEVYADDSTKPQPSPRDIQDIDDDSESSFRTAPERSSAEDIGEVSGILQAIETVNRRLRERRCTPSYPLRGKHGYRLRGLGESSQNASSNGPLDDAYDFIVEKRHVAGKSPGVLKASGSGVEDPHLMSGALPPPERLDNDHPETHRGVSSAGQQDEQRISWLRSPTPEPYPPYNDVAHQPSEAPDLMDRNRRIVVAKPNATQVSRISTSGEGHMVNDIPARDEPLPRKTSKLTPSQSRYRSKGEKRKIRRCRYCRSDAKLLGPLRSFCACKGKRKFVHCECLLRRMLYSRAMNCEFCGQRYQMSGDIYSPRVREAQVTSHFHGEKYQRPTKQSRHSFGKAIRRTVKRMFGRTVAERPQIGNS